jgi:uncharacterized membrane protein
MAYLVLGLLVFLGVHSLQIFAPQWRLRTMAQYGEGTFKAVYSLLSLAGFVLLVWGFGMARETPTMVWMPPVGMRHAASLLTLVAFVLLAAAYVPRNHIKARLHHPMVLAVKIWAFAHLVANGSLAHLLLFGGFLLWAVACFAAARRRDREQGTVYPAGTALGTVAAVGVGMLAWLAFALWLHGMLIGVKPFG